MYYKQGVKTWSIYIVYSLWSLDSYEVWTLKKNNHFAATPTAETQFALCFLGNSMIWLDALLNKIKAAYRTCLKSEIDHFDWMDWFSSPPFTLGLERSNTGSEPPCFWHALSWSWMCMIVSLYFYFFFLSLLSICVFNSICIPCYHMVWKILHMRFSSYSS